MIAYYYYRLVFDPNRFDDEGLQRQQTSVLRTLMLLKKKDTYRDRDEK